MKELRISWEKWGELSIENLLNRNRPFTKILKEKGFDTDRPIESFKDEKTDERVYRQE